MRSRSLQKILLLSMLAVGFCCFRPIPAGADSLKLLTDLEYELSNTETTTKATETTPESRDKAERATFSQVYSLDIQKEIFPTLKMGLGGLFDMDSTRTETTDLDTMIIDRTESSRTAVRPFFDLRYSSRLLDAMTGYRKSEVKTKNEAITDRVFVEEYSNQLNWNPAGLPELNLDFSRTLLYDEPLSNDQRVDNYQLRSRYLRGDYRFDFYHTTNDVLNKLNGAKTLSNYDDGSVRFSHTYQQGKISFSSRLRGSRQLVEFSGGAVPEVPVFGGTIQVNDDDQNPVSSDPEENQSLSDIELLVAVGSIPRQLSFGYDFGEQVEVSKIALNISDSFALPVNFSDSFNWSIYVRDNEIDDWIQLSPGPVATTDVAENRIELSFTTVETRYIKVVTTQIVSPETDLQIASLTAFRALPVNTAEFEQVDFSGNFSVNWKMTDSTSSGYDLLYREQRSQPLDERSSLLNAGARLSHIFNEVFTGALRAQSSTNRQRGEDPNFNNTFSAVLRAKYLETFNQSLNYGFSHQYDEESRTSLSQSVFLRSNLQLYRGLSLFLDNGYSWRSPAEEEDSQTTYLRVGSNIIPNRWVNLSLLYGVSWEQRKGEPDSCSQDGSLFVSWVPTAALSLSASLQFSDDTGANGDSTFSQQYSANWSPFRDGTLNFSMAYSQSMNDKDEQVWNLSPTISWQINRSSLLSLDYTIGQQEDDQEIVDFENISLKLRIFY